MLRADVAPSFADITLELIARARTAESVDQADFIAVNDTHLLAPYRQSALWSGRAGITALSGLALVERNAPYVLWLNKVCKALPADRAHRVTANDVAADLGGEWEEWLPPYGLWIPVSPGRAGAGALFLARDNPWTDGEIQAIVDWLTTWSVVREALIARTRTAPAGVRWLHALGRGRRRWIAATSIVAVLAIIPVRISVLAPGELVPAEPIAIRAPLDGVVSQFFIKPNDQVKAGQPLFAFDTLQLGSRLEVAVQAVNTAEAELRQYTQQALTDAKARAALPAARGNVSEKRAELEFLRGQRGRAQVVAAQDGYVLFDDPTEWIGKPVTTGERIMRLAILTDKEVEAWIPVADAIPLPEKAPARLYLSADPLQPVSATVRYVAHEAIKRPDGAYAYRLRATLDAPVEHRVGLKGTVRLSGERVPLIYWIIRRPLAAIREFLGM